MDNFFYNLNKKMSDLAQRQDLAESAVAERDMGKHNNATTGFKALAKKAGGGEKGNRIAGAQFQKMKKAGQLEEGHCSACDCSPCECDSMEESAFQAAIGKKKYGDAGMKALQKAGRDNASDSTMNNIRNRYDKYDESVMEGHCSACDCAPCQCNEGNAFSKAVVDAKRDGIQKGEKISVGGKTYPVREAGKPMSPKQKSFAKLAPPVDKITFADKIAGAKKEVDEMLGDVAATAMKNAVAPRRNQDAMAGKQDLKRPGKEHPLRNVAKGIKAFVQGKDEPMDEEKTKEPRSKGTAFDPEYQAQAKKEKEGTGNFDKKKISTGTVYTRKHKDDEEDEVKSDQPKVKGRPKGPAKGPERVTAKSYKYKGGRPVKENDISMADQGEYDQEGDMAKEQLHTIKLAARELASILSDNENLPEWVQSKITKAMDYIDTARDYMIATKADGETMAERSNRPVQKPAKGRKPDFLDMDSDGDKKEPMKKAVADKKEKKVSETTTSGSVATATDTKKSSGSMQFGKGVYEGAIAESYEKKLNTVLAEAMNVTVTMNNQTNGGPNKTINVSADGEDAEKLAEILKLAGLGGLGGQAGGCSSCGQAPCGCQTMDEAYGDTNATMNSPDYPTDTETIDGDDPYLRRFSGGLNGAKSTGQTTVPVIAGQMRRTSTMEENVELERSLFNTWKTYKGK
jgi:hypothetical protein